MTARAGSFITASLIFYFFANQTQIGWVYVLSAMLMAVVCVGFVLNIGLLRGLTATRHITPESPSATLALDALEPLAYHEDDPIRITLTVKAMRWSIPQVRVVETCAVADPLSPDSLIQMYIPSLSKTGVAFSYSLPLYRRGVYAFPALKILSRAPFGFFKREKTRAVATTLLVYPVVKPLKTLALLDKQPNSQMSYPKAGMGNEVIGVRDFRSGDSPRHIHWRSVARKGTLISKEFAEETQEGLTLFIDRYAPYDNTLSKHTPFEMAVKCAVSIAEYALRQRFNLYISAWSDDFALLNGALSWDAFLQYSARVPADDQAHIADLLTRTSVQQFIAVVLSVPDERVLEPLLALQRRGVNILVVIIDGKSFPIENGVSAVGLAERLQAFGIAVKTIRHGDEWATLLSETTATHISPSTLVP